MNNTFLISLFTFFIFLIFKYRKAYYMLQQNSYNTSDRYIKWVIRNTNKTIFTYEIFILLAFFIINYTTKDFIMANLLFYIPAIILELRLIKKEQQKKKFVVTKRVKRLIYTTIILLVLLLISILTRFDDRLIFEYSLRVFFFGYLSYIITFFIYVINIPIEKIVYYYFLNKAKNNLKGRTRLEVVGITGSYGKTSSKNILHDILSSKYSVYKTKKSFNTPYGLMTSINNELDKFSEIFIAEMGACKLGDINELCDIVNPKYGIITKIGVAHLETFKSEYNIQKGKFELIERLPIDGIGILNRDDINQTTYKIKNKCKIIWIGIDNKEADIYATNIKLSSNGSTFDIKFKGSDKKYKFETILLGKHNIYNVLSSIALALELGIRIEDIQKSVKRLSQIEHRLELKKYEDITIIDDAFNSNPEGSKSALEVLSMMNGKKIIVTPGMIELGDKQYELNKKFGEYIKEVCDEVILVGEKQTQAIYEGLIESGYNKNNIYVINDVKEAFKIIRKLKDKETFVLLENDLPDIFSE